MRDTAFKRYARNQVELLWSAKRRRSSAPTESSPDDHELPADDAPSVDDETRTPFARELGAGWVEVEPGIYQRAPSPSSEPVLRTVGP